MAWSIAEMVLRVWATHQLDREPAQAAMAVAERKRRRLRIAAVTGCVLALLAVGLKEGINHDAAAAHARLLAEEQVGPSDHYSVQTLNLRWTIGVQSRRAIVDAWNDTELKQLSVTWP